MAAQGQQCNSDTDGAEPSRHGSGNQRPRLSTTQIVAVGGAVATAIAGVAAVLTVILGGGDRSGGEPAAIEVIIQDASPVAARAEPTAPATSAVVPQTPSPTPIQRPAFARCENLRKDANLRGCDLDERDLRGIDFDGADLRGANLIGSVLTGSSFRNANLSGADMRNSDLRGAILDGANLSGADLAGAQAVGISMDGTIWSSTRCPDGIDSDNADGTCEGHLSPG